MKGNGKKRKGQQKISPTNRLRPVRSDLSDRTKPDNSLGQSVDRWRFAGRPLHISLVANTILFALLFLVFFQDREGQPTVVTITPLEERYTTQTLRQKKKRVAQRRTQIQKKVARENARHRAVQTSSNQAYRAPVRDSDASAPQTGQISPNARTNRPHYQFRDSTFEDVGRPKGGRPGPASQSVPEYRDSQSEAAGPQRAQGGPTPGLGPRRTSKSWGGPGADGSRLVFSPNPGYPGALQQSGVQGEVKIQVYFLPDGRAYEVRVLSVAHRELINAVRRKVMKWRASPSHLGGKRYLQTTFIFSL